jgi:DNA polymerase III subunit delta'
MISNLSKNRNLYGMDVNFREIINLYNLNKLPNKILFSGKRGVGKSTLAHHIINYILSENEEFRYDLKKLYINKDNKSYRLIINNSHPNYYLIDLINEKKDIDIGQIRQMFKYVNKSSFNQLPRFVLIDNIEHLSKSSVNALLKVVEEPNEGVFFILIHNSEKRILQTLKSRCLIFNINFSFNHSISIVNRILKQNVLDLINFDLISYYTTPGDLINLVNFAKEKKIDLRDYNLIDFLNLLINNSYYKKDKFVKNLIINFLELYLLKRYQLTNTKSSFINLYHIFLEKFKDTEKFNLDEESLFMELKSKLL